MAKVIGYHACERQFAERLQSGDLAVAEWLPSQNTYDWLGQGIYFWEGSLRRAKEWAADRVGGDATILAAEIDLGVCFDLTNSDYLDLLGKAYERISSSYRRRKLALPTNEGGFRRLDCLVINEFVVMMAKGGTFPPVVYQTIRCPFEEGEPVFPASMIRRQTHIQIAVRDSSCIRITDFNAL